MNGLRVHKRTVLIFMGLLFSCFLSAKSSENWTLVELGIIGTASDDILSSAMDQVRNRNHAGLIIQLDTPGGALNSTRQMVKKIMSAEFPVVVWVGPDGSRAGSAGAFITLAGHVAAMARGTNIGAAHPIQANGQDVESGHAAKKVEEDTTAFIESIAKRRGRNVDMARSFVLTSASITAEEAKENKVIDLLANDLPTLMSDMDGMVVRLSGDSEHTIRSKGADLVPYSKTLKQEFLSILSDPQIFYLLFVAGLIGLGFELTHPGAIFPGVAGAICLILALIATSVLPVSFGAMLLAVAGVVFLIVEAFVPSFGVLGIGGFLAFIIGSFLLVDPGNEQGLRLPLMTILPIRLFVGAAGLALGYVILKSETSRAVIGTESMIGKSAIVHSPFIGRQGRVRFEGEDWHAELSDESSDVDVGSTVTIKNIEGLKLIVTNKII